jgi:hypothetical protein
MPSRDQQAKNVERGGGELHPQYGCRTPDVNAANEAGITNILPIHDSFSFLAPQADHGHRTLRVQLALLYQGADHIAELRRLNVGNADFEDPPERGNLNPLELILAKHAFS